MKRAKTILKFFLGYIVIAEILGVTLFFEARSYLFTEYSPAFSFIILVVFAPLFLLIANLSFTFPEIILFHGYIIGAFICCQRRCRDVKHFQLKFVLVAWLLLGIALLIRYFIDQDFYFEEKRFRGEPFTQYYYWTIFSCFLVFPVFALISLRKPKP